LSAFDLHTLDLIKSREGVIDVKITSPRRITATVSPGSYRTFVEFLAQSGFEHVVAITGVDTGNGIEVLLHLGTSTVVTVKTLLSPDTPELDSVADILQGIPFYEREVHDLLGVKILNNPDMSRVMLPADWPEGVYPLRRSFVSKTPEPLRKVD